MSTSLISGSLRVNDGRNQLLSEPGDVHSAPGRVDPVSKKYYRVFTLGLSDDRGAGETSVSGSVSQRCHPLLIAGHTVGAFVGRSGHRGYEGLANAGRQLLPHPAAQGFKERQKIVRRSEEPSVTGGPSQFEGGLVVNLALHHPATRLVFGRGNVRTLRKCRSKTCGAHSKWSQNVALHHLRQDAAC